MKIFVMFEIICVSIATVLLISSPTPSETSEVETTVAATTIEETETEAPETTTVEETTTEETTEIYTTCVEETTVPETEAPEITIEETTAPETEAPVTEPEEELYIALTDEEKRILATLIRLEAGGASYECQMAVGSVVLNRMAKWNKTLEQVVFQKNQFSPAYLINRKYKNGEYVYKPYDICWRVVDDLCKNGPSIPYYVLYFRAGHHHKWAIPYCEMDGTYFSYLEKHK